MLPFAGHAYPTGSTRRGLRLYVQLDDGPEHPLTTLVDQLDDPSDTSNTEPALKPGETRRFSLPSSTGRVRVRRVYLRNRFKPDSYTAEILSLDRQLPGTNDPRSN